MSVPESLLFADAKLIVHPDTPTAAVRRIVVGVSWQPDAGTLALRYRLDGDAGRLALPGAAPSRRVDGLWHHTCFEAFVRPVGSDGYCEFNFSPSTEWAAYRFASPRCGMLALELATAPAIRCSRDRDRVDLDVTLAAGAWNGPIDLGLAAVTEDRDGSLAYWALLHPGGRPDFHHPASFALRLDPALAAPAVGGGP